MKWLFLFAFTLIQSFLFGISKDEKCLAVVIPSYNNIAWYKQNLSSIFAQEYENYYILYTDDNSSDGTAAAVQAFVEENNQNHRFILIHNQQRLGAMENLYNMIMMTDDEEVVVIIDGDDWLYDNTVFARLNHAYTHYKVWYSHGRLVNHPSGYQHWCLPISRTTIKSQSYRDFRCPTHLRTFYSWLFKLIKKEDLMYEGKFLPMTYDLAIMFPIAEMAAERHAFMRRLTYVYNEGNPINDNKVNADLQKSLEEYIRAKPKYPRLTKRP